MGMNSRQCTFLLRFQRSLLGECLIKSLRFNQMSKRPRKRTSLRSKMKSMMIATNSLDGQLKRSDYWTELSLGSIFFAWIFKILNLLF